MERGERGRRDHGGIAWLAGEIERYAGAIDYDLMTRTTYTLDDLGGRLRWRSLAHFLRYLPEDSAYVRALRPQDAEALLWTEGKVTALVVADLINELRGFLYAYVKAHSKQGTFVQSPKPYKTPWTSDEELGVRRIGKGAIPVTEFDAWWAAQDKATRHDSKGT